MPHPVIRPFEDADLDAVITIFQRSVREIASADYDPAQIEAWAQVDRAAWAAPSRVRLRWVAWVEAAAAGFADLGAEGHLEKLYVHPTHRRIGVARALLATVEAAMVARGLDAVHTEASLTAQAFFGSCGFRIVEEETVLRNGQAFRRARMRKDGLPAR